MKRTEHVWYVSFPNCTLHVAASLLLQYQAQNKVMRTARRKLILVRELLASEG